MTRTQDIPYYPLAREHRKGLRFYQRLFSTVFYPLSLCFNCILMYIVYLYQLTPFAKFLFNTCNEIKRHENLWQSFIIKFDTAKLFLLNSSSTVLEVPGKNEYTIVLFYLRTKRKVENFGAFKFCFTKGLFLACKNLI